MQIKKSPTNCVLATIFPMLQDSTLKRLLKMCPRWKRNQELAYQFSPLWKGNFGWGIKEKLLDISDIGDICFGHFRQFLWTLWLIFRISPIFFYISPFVVSQFGVGVPALIWTIWLNISDHFWGILGLFWAFFGPFDLIFQTIFGPFEGHFGHFFITIFIHGIWCLHSWQHFDQLPKKWRPF